MKQSAFFAAVTAVLVVASSDLIQAQEQWSRFRGPAGNGVHATAKLPTEWNEQKNVRWKVALPGPGSSSPIFFGDKLFVTCYSGYGVSQDNVGDVNDLARHLVCIDRNNGEALWSNKAAAKLPEDAYNGYLTEHGYASNSPVTDGKSVFAFFGKTGVFAYDMDGNELWNVHVGQESANRRWGSGASLILYKDTVIVNASEESKSILALNKATGEKKWTQPAAALELAYTTPALASLADGTQELVIPVPGEVWGLNPDTGKLKWYCETGLTGNISPMALSQKGTIFAFGGFRGAGSMAIKAGGEKDVTNTNVVWTSRESSYVATPVLHNGHFYWVDDRGLAHCSSAENGESVYRERLPNVKSGGRPFYASPVLVDGKLYCVSRWSGTYIIAAKPEFELIAHNIIASDESDFSGTPAIAKDAMYVRSNSTLYCIGE
jgi:outer membrane protein assembly factor BamB